jgi:hypothetical protein
MPILDAGDWLYLKLFKQMRVRDDWRAYLDWFHDTLRTIIKPWVASHNDVSSVFFLNYIEDYHVEEQNYERRIDPSPTGRVSFIRLRAYVPQNRSTVKADLLAAIRASTSPVNDYEILDGYDVRSDLGKRFAKLGRDVNDEVTILFVSYLDSACRFILRVMGSGPNWDSGVDVWGIPHLINNSLGGWLRTRHARCSICGAEMYMAAGQVTLQSPVQVSEVPTFLFICPSCETQIVGSSNI